jgi:predicted nucleic acid-binding protein
MTFIDSGAFLGRYLARDPYRKASLKLWGELHGTRLITTNHVLEETFTMLARRAGYSFAAERAELIYASSAFEIVHSSRQDELEAIRYFRKYTNQNVSFTDCISFAIMKRHSIRTAFTFDRHFTIAGFQLLDL